MSQQALPHFCGDISEALKQANLLNLLPFLKRTVTAVHLPLPHRHLFFLFLILFSTTAFTAEFNVDTTLDGVDENLSDGICAIKTTKENKCTLRAAVQQSNALVGEDVIRLPAGIYGPRLGSTDENAAAEGDFDILDDLVIVGVGADQTTITGDTHQYRVFEILKRDDDTLPKVVIRDIKLTQGLDNTEGSLIYSAGDLTLDNVTITKGGVGSSAVYNYGTTYSHGNRLTIRNSRVNGNSRGIYSSYGVTLIENTEFTGNGAAVLLDYGRSEIRGSTFNSNDGTLDSNHSYGGAVHLNGGVAYIEDSTFDTNKARYGGALSSYGTLMIRGCEFRNNSAETGGAFYLAGQSYIADTTVNANSSEVHGGGLYLYPAGKTTLHRVIITGNEAGGSGGGIYHNGGGAVHVVDSEISTNTASTLGGGVAAVYGGITISNSLIAGNISNSGGGVYTSGDNNSLQNTTVSGNTARQAGGGLYNVNRYSYSEYKVVLKNVTLADNSAPAGTGGNIANESSIVRLANTIVVNPGSGGDCSGEITTLGHNIDSDNTCGLTLVNDQPGVIVPVLADLADNGGRSHTHALLTGSPAISAIDIGFCPDVDQRHYYRKATGGNCDIGAFESGSVRAQSGQLAFKLAEFFVGEEDTTATIILTRTGGSEGAVSVEYYDVGGGSANSGADYTIIADDELIWPDGDNSDRRFEVTIDNDSSEEGFETINLGLRKAFGGASLGEVNNAVLYIRDDDAQYGSFRFSDSTTRRVRENEGQLTVIVTRSGGSYGHVTVDYATSDGEAMAGRDYTAVSGTLTFPHDETRMSITVPITDDTAQEGDETFTLTLSNPTWGAEIGAPGEVTVTIVGNDNSGPTPEPTSAPDPVSEPTPAPASGGGGGAFDPLNNLLFGALALVLLRNRRRSLLR